MLVKVQAGRIGDGGVGTIEVSYNGMVLRYAKGVGGDHADLE